MTKTKQSNVPKKKDNDSFSNGTPAFPYTTKPKSLRKFLEMIPNKPKPPKITTSTLKVWGFKDANDSSILRVLKELGLLTTAGEPTDYYAAFMQKTTGAEALGERIKITYEKLFQNVANPEKASGEDLLSFFNIHSGGGSNTIKFQIDTFRALASYATFSGVSVNKNGTLDSAIDKPAGDQVGNNYSSKIPEVRIDLHIHLPENGSKTDYESIIESIAKLIYKNEF